MRGAGWRSIVRKRRRVFSSFFLGTRFPLADKSLSSFKTYTRARTNLHTRTHSAFAKQTLKRNRRLFRRPPKPPPPSRSPSSLSAAAP